MDETPNKNEMTPDQSTNPLPNRYNPDQSPIEMKLQENESPVRDFSKQRKSRRERNNNFTNEII